MQTKIFNALLIDIKEKSFKGHTGENVTFKQVRFLDDSNGYHEATVDKDCQLPENWASINRDEADIVISVDEVTQNGNTRLKKKLLSIS